MWHFLQRAVSSDAEAMHEVTINLTYTRLECIGPEYVCFASHVYDFFLFPWFPAFLNDDARWWENRTTVIEPYTIEMYTRDEVVARTEEIMELRRKVFCLTVILMVAAVLILRILRVTRAVFHNALGVMLCTLCVLITDWLVAYLRPLPEGSVDTSLYKTDAQIIAFPLQPTLIAASVITLHAVLFKKKTH